MVKLLSICVGLWVCILFEVPALVAYNICDANMIDAAQKYQVPLPILYAVSMAEAGVKQIIQPYALNIDRHSIFPQTKEQALFEIKKAKQNGAKYIDIGCMQVNERYHGKNFGSLLDMLDPKQNINYAASFLHKLYQAKKSWTGAVARYHTGDKNKAEQKRYVCKVIKQLVATGLGKDISASVKLCANL